MGPERLWIKVVSHVQASCPPTESQNAKLITDINFESIIDIYIHICMYVCMYVYMCVYRYTYMYICVVLSFITETEPCSLHVKVCIFNLKDTSSDIVTVTGLEARQFSICEL